MKSHPQQGGRWLGVLGLPEKEDLMNKAGSQEPWVGVEGARCSPSARQPHWNSG